MSKPGFTLFRFWLQMYRLATNAPQIIGKIDPAQGRVFNREVKLIKNMYGLSDDDMEYMIMFLYLHNPLNLPVLKDCGTIANLRESAPAFLRWRRDYKQAILEMGMTKAMKITMPIKAQAQTENLVDLLQDMLDSNEYADSVLA